MSRWWRSVAGLGATALAVVGAMMVPGLLGASWHDVAAQLARIGMPAGVAIAALWITGLVCYTVAMRATMPGLTPGRALALNLAGSSAANLLPFGGVVGAGINLAMIRSWRLSGRSFASSVAVLGVVNLLGKLALPVAAGAILVRDLGSASLLARAALALGVLLLIVVALVVGGLISRSWAGALDTGWRWLRRAAPSAQSGPVERLRLETRVVLRQGWRTLAAGMTGYLLLQWALFALCLHLTGVTTGAGAVFAAFAVERAVTLAVITPAGAGLAEASAAGLLVAMGASPVAATAGVVLYRLFVYAAEIPVGAAVLAGWALQRRRVGAI